MIDSNIVINFVDKLIEEKEIHILIKILKLLELLLEGSVSLVQFLNTNCIVRLLSLIDHKND